MTFLPQIEPVLDLNVIDRIALRSPIRNQEDAVKYLSKLIIRPIEQVFAVFLASNLKPIAYMCCGSGNSHRCLVDVRGLVASALMINAEAVILVHTHPALAGKPHTPSQRDLRTTKKLREILDFFGMTLMDSFILEHCSENLEHLSLTSIIDWIKDAESASETEEPEKEVAHS